MHQPPARYPLHSNNSFLREISTAGGDGFFVALAALWCCIACIPLLLLQSQALEMEGMVMEQGIRERKIETWNERQDQRGLLLLFYVHFMQ